jgi:hypothetical protein
MSIVNKMSLVKLSNGDFLQFFTNTIGYAISDPNLGVILQPMSNLLPRLELSYKKESLSTETAMLIELDVKRDNSYLRVKKLAEGHLYDDENPANKAAAQAIVKLIKFYGGSKLAYEDMNKETADITSFVTDCTQKYANEINQLGLNGPVSFLSANNENFNNYYKQRDALSAQMNNIVPFYKLRKPAIVAYKNFTNDLMSLARINPALEMQVKNVIDLLNANSKHYELLIPKKVKEVQMEE